MRESSIEAYFRLEIKMKHQVLFPFHQKSFSFQLTYNFDSLEYHILLPYSKITKTWELSQTYVY